MTKSSTSILECPRSMVGRVIGKNGETVKALQTYTGATIQIDQTVDPTRVSITGAPYSLSLAVSMVTDIVRGSFKGFALLRQATRPPRGQPGYPGYFTEPRPVYAPGYGLIPASQLYDDRGAGVNGMAVGMNGFTARMGDQLQQVYPLVGPATITANGGLLALPADGSQYSHGNGTTTTLVNGLNGLNGITVQGTNGQTAMISGPNGTILAPGEYLLTGHTGGEDYAVSAGHRLIQAAGGRGNNNAFRKAWLG